MSCIRVLWLCPYPVFKLEKVLKIDRPVTTHAASWITNLSEELSSFDDVELHVATLSPYVKAYRTGKMGNINFHVIRYAVPFTLKGIPDAFNIAKKTAYATLRLRFLQLVRKIDPALIHAHGVEGPYALIASYLNKPYLVSIQGILEEYASFGNETVSSTDLRNERDGVLRARNFGCRTSFDKEFVQRTNPYATIFHLPEAMNPVYFERSWNGQSSSQIVFVGSLNERKGLMVLLQAILSIESIKLLVVGQGGGKYLEKVKAYIEATNMQHRVEFLGQQDARSIAKLHESSRMFVLPTFLDNSPNSLAEAMAVGIPSIASRVGGIPSMINDGTNGLLFTPGDVEDLKRCILSLMNSEELCNSISTAASKHAFQEHHPSIVAPKYLKVYKDLIEVSK